MADKPKKMEKPEGYVFGRPTKYRKELIQEVYDYVEKTDIPFVEEFALKFALDETTLQRWQKKHKTFNKAIKVLKMKQKLALQKASLSKKYNVAGSIFQLKANHGMMETEKRIVQPEGELNVNVNYESNPDNPHVPQAGTGE